MTESLLLEYGGIILILIALEGVLSADNALVLAIGVCGCFLSPDPSET